MDPLDEMIKKHLETRRSGALGIRPTEAVPGTEDFYHYLTGELEGERLQEMLTYLVRNRWAQEMVIQARQMLEPDPGAGEAPGALVKKAKNLMARTAQKAPCPHCGKPITPFKRSITRQRWTNFLWLVLMAGSFGLSFVFPRYFMQFLVVALLAGVKWAVEMRAAKTQIMIYKALSEEPGSEEHRLHRHSAHL